jgi:hypothetical protein
MKKLIVPMALMLSTPTMAQDFKLKGATDIDTTEIGAEIQMQSDSPKGYGVFGVDLDVKDLLPTFNFGYNHKFEKVEALAYVGFGLRKECDAKTVPVTASVGAVNGGNGQGNNGQGNSTGNGSNNGKKGGNGNGNGNGSNGGGGTTAPTNPTPTQYTTICEDGETVYQELGVRIVPRLDSRVKPLLEISTSSENSGFDFDHTAKIGVIVDL